MTPQDVMQLIENSGVKMVDGKVTDLFGQWQHFSMPVEAFDIETGFEDGMGFDGSSIRGFQSIENSDMVVRQGRALRSIPDSADDQRIMAGRLAEIVTQRADLIGSVDVAGKQDEPKGFHVAKQRFFLGAQTQTFGIQYRGTIVHRVVTGMQSAFSATRAEQNRRASAISSNPMARRR
mgnify:CR=1 FL=1